MEIKVYVPLEHKGFWECVLPVTRTTIHQNLFAQMAVDPEPLELDADCVESFLDVIMAMLGPVRSKHLLLISGSIRFPDEGGADESFAACQEEAFSYDASVKNSRLLQDQISIWSCNRIHDAIVEGKPAPDLLSNYERSDFTDADVQAWEEEYPTRKHVIQVIRKGTRIHAANLLHRILVDPTLLKTMQGEVSILMAKACHHDACSLLDVDID